MTPNRLDRLIAFMSPRWAIRRLQARQALARAAEPPPRPSVYSSRHEWLGDWHAPVGERKAP